MRWLSSATSIFFFFLTISCDSSQEDKRDGGLLPDTAKQSGAEGGPCYANGTCNKGLTCASNLCVRLPDAGTQEDIAADKGSKDVSFDATLDLPVVDASTPDSTQLDTTSDISSGDYASDAGKCSTNKDCDDGLNCTTDLCTVGGCANILNGNFCLIAKTCIPSGSQNPANLCQKCVPVTSPTAWSNQPKGKSCNDNNFCTSSDKCQNGKCKGSPVKDKTKCDDGAKCTYNDRCVSGVCSGTSYTCNNLSCATAVCNGTNGCDYTVNTTSCLIGLKCYSDGGVDPATNCHKCDAQKAKTNWTPVAASGCVTTHAGTGVAGLLDGKSDAAKFSWPYGLALGPGGKLYIADNSNHCIRVVDGGKVTTLAGTGVSGFADGPAGLAKFNTPQEIAVDAAGKVYVSDLGNYRIRVVHKGQVSTLAGSSTYGFVDGPALSAKFYLPRGIAVDGSGKVYVADVFNQRIRMVYNGQVSTIAGSGAKGYQNGPAASAKFNMPTDVAVDGTGKLFISDQGNHSIRTLFSGTVATLAGTGSPGYSDGAATSSMFKSPFDISIGKGGALYVADWGNKRIRKVLSGMISTIAGSGTAGFLDGPAAKVMFKSPAGIAVDALGKVFVGDSQNNRIRMLTP